MISFKAESFFTESRHAVRSAYLNISTHFPQAMAEALDIWEDEIHRDDFLICPHYRRGDIQIGGTGTLKKMELFDEGYARESLEELKILPKGYYRTYYIDDHVTWWIVFTSFAGGFEVTNEEYTFSQEPDVDEEKVGFYYWAPRSYWLANMPKINQRKLNDNINKFYFLSMRDVLKVTEQIRSLPSLKTRSSPKKSPFRFKH